MGYPLTATRSNPTRPPRRATSCSPTSVTGSGEKSGRVRVDRFASIRSPVTPRAGVQRCCCRSRRVRRRFTRRWRSAGNSFGNQLGRASGAIDLTKLAFCRIGPNHAAPGLNHVRIGGGKLPNAVTWLGRASNGPANSEIQKNGGAVVHDTSTTPVGESGGGAGSGPPTGREYQSAII